MYLLDAAGNIVGPEGRRPAQADASLTAGHARQPARPLEVLVTNPRRGRAAVTAAGMDDLALEHVHGIPWTVHSAVVLQDDNTTDRRSS